MRHGSDGGGGNFGQDIEGGNTSVARELDTTKSGCLTFDPGGMSTINWSPIGVQVLEYSISSRGDPSSDPRHKTTGSSTIPIPEDSCEMLTHTPRLVENHHTMGPKRLNQPEISSVNLD